MNPLVVFLLVTTRERGNEKNFVLLSLSAREGTSSCLRWRSGSVKQNQIRCKKMLNILLAYFTSWPSVMAAAGDAIFSSPVMSVQSLAPGFLYLRICVNFASPRYG